MLDKYVKVNSRIENFVTMGSKATLFRTTLTISQPNFSSPKFTILCGILWQWQLCDRRQTALPCTKQSQGTAVNYIAIWLPCDCHQKIFFFYKISALMMAAT